MKILLTGNNGYVGTILTDELIKKGYSVTGFDVNYFETIVNSKNLFMNQGWDLNKLINYSFVSNSETVVLKNRYLFLYNGRKTSKCLPIIIDGKIQTILTSHEIEKQVNYFDNFVMENLDISLYTLIYKRIIFFNEFIFPTG